NEMRARPHAARDHETGSWDLSSVEDPSGAGALRLPGLQAQKAFVRFYQRLLVGARAIGLDQKVQAGANRRDAADAEPTCAAGHGPLVAAPDQDGARLGVDRDVEAILRAIVHDDVELQRRSDFAARGRDHEE